MYSGVLILEVDPHVKRQPENVMKMGGVEKNKVVRLSLLADGKKQGIYDKV